MKWQPIETAPKDGTFIRIKFADGKTIRAAFEGGLLDTDWKDCGGWMAPDDDAPTCWTDGICWEVNEDDIKSKEPTHWMPLPNPPSP